MSADLETRLRDAFTARAATTTTASDAWARVDRRVARHDQRRSVVLRSVAVAVIGILVVAGGVALLGGNHSSNTVATGSAASKSESAADAAGPFLPVDGGLEVQQNADGTIVVRLGSTTTAPVHPGGTSVAINGDTVFGVVPAAAGSVQVTAATGPGIIKMVVADLAPTSGPYRTFRIAGFPSTVDSVTISVDGVPTVVQRGGNR